MFRDRESESKRDNSAEKSIIPAKGIVEGIKDCTLSSIIRLLFHLDFKGSFI